MRFFGPGWAAFIAMPCFDGEGEGGGGGGGDRDAAYYKAEAKKAFEARDTLKQELREAKEGGLLITAEQKQRLADLEQAAADAEDDKKRKAGEFDTLRKDLTTKHETEKQGLTTQLSALQQEIANDKILAAFGAATDYFGGGDSRTILTPMLAFKTLGEYIRYEEFDFGEDDGGKRKVLVVRDTKGKIIRDDEGGPAAFADAIDRLIASHPDKDHILRGSGKAGSGARGGSGDRKTGKVDFNHLTDEQMRDPKIREEAKRRTAKAGGIVMGDAWERASAAKS